MTATTKVERSGPAIRAALAEFAPDECAQFEAEYAQALSRAGAACDLAPAEAVLDRWWGIAATRANPPSEQERAQVTRAEAGDFTRLLARNEYGDWDWVRL
jgi:hypothetical protein